jgi:aspartate racemase
MITLSESAKNRTRIQAELQMCINKLKVAGVDIVAIACNTLHSFLDAIDLKDTHYVNMPQAVLEYAKENALKKLLVLGTPTTIKSGIYAAPELITIAPSLKNQTSVTAIIDALLEGIVGQEDAHSLKDIAQRVFSQTPFDGIILGCTELPILYEQYQKDLRGPWCMIDSLDIVERSIVGQVVD